MIVIKNQIKEVKDPVECLVTAFELKDIKEFRKAFEDACLTGQPYIPVVINSYGGDYNVMNEFISIVENSPLPVATICNGTAASAGVLLFSYGKPGYRFASKNAIFCIHEVQQWIKGSSSTLQYEAKETDRLNKYMLSNLARNCGKDYDWIHAHLKERMNTDWYLNAQEAKEIGLVDHILDRPLHFKIETTTKYTLEF